MSSRSELKNRIQELGDRLSALNSEDKRIKKRILQKLGKLKKELITAEENGEGGGGGDEEGQATGEEKTEGNPSWTKKQSKLKLKIANSDLAELAQKKQLKAAQKKFQWCVKKGLKPGESLTNYCIASASLSLPHCSLLLLCCVLCCAVSAAVASVDVHTYTNLLNAYVRCKEMEGAAVVWAQMINAEIEPNIVTYTTLIKGYCESDSIASAQSLLLDMLSGHSTSSSHTSPPLPNHRTLNTFWRDAFVWSLGQRESHTRLRRDWRSKPRQHCRQAHQEWRGIGRWQRSQCPELVRDVVSIV
jgi:pentatricopeptide repeat protein